MSSMASALGIVVVVWMLPEQTETAGTVKSTGACLGGGGGAGIAPMAFVMFYLPQKITFCRHT